MKIGTRIPIATRSPGRMCSRFSVGAEVGIEIPSYRPLYKPGAGHAGERTSPYPSSFALRLLDG